MFLVLILNMAEVVLRREVGKTKTLRRQFTRVTDIGGSTLRVAELSHRPLLLPGRFNVYFTPGDTDLCLTY